MMVLFAQIWATVRHHPIIAGGLVIAVLAGAANYPLARQREAAARQHEETRRKGEAMLAALTDRQRINTDLEILTEAQEVIDRNLVKEDNMEVNLGYFFRLEKQTKVRLVRADQMGALPAEKDSPFKVVSVSLQVAGTYRNLLGFVRELETGPRIMRLSSYRLERTDPSGTELSLNLMVELLAQP